MPEQLALDQLSANITNLAQNATPMMQQYHAIKQQYPDCLLFYRMGDFYELFFADAEIAANILDIALTKRGKQQGQDIPMCGVPFHAAENYLYKLIIEGYKVAICEQMESPEEAKKRGYKAVVKREVIRVVTPGTLTEEALLAADQENYLLAIAAYKEELALAWVDISTGVIRVSSSNTTQLATDFSRLNPSECLVSEATFHKLDLAQYYPHKPRLFNQQPGNIFDLKRAENQLQQFYNLQDITVIGKLNAAHKIACGALLEYLLLTQQNNLPPLALPQLLEKQQFMQLDNSTIRNLEIFDSLNGKTGYSLYKTINKCNSAPGSRLLRQNMAYPLLCPVAIKQRQEKIAYFIQELDLRQKLRQKLQEMPDFIRAVSRLCMQRGGPRDLVQIRQALAVAVDLRLLLEHSPVSPLIHPALPQLTAASALQAELKAALIPDPSFLARDGGFIASHYHAELDKLRHIKQNHQKEIQLLKQQYCRSTGVSGLKIEYTQQLGYYVEVTNMHSNKLQEPLFQHRQTLKNNVRFTTNELKQLEGNIITAKERAIAIEMAIFQELVEKIAAATDALSQINNLIAELDMFAALAELAVENHYIRPVVNDSTEIRIIGGRHPVVEKVLAKTRQDFVPNDLEFNQKQQLCLLTGPNMAGKSTYLRQNVLITILAQLGSFVPASQAEIGIVDAIFSRIGAADDLAAGKSTFMVEMVEAATILHQATARSLVVLDEIGRGTATYDGLAIAWAMVEYISQQLHTRTIFATHYHELTALEGQLPGIFCANVLVREWQGKIIFCHQVKPGKADRSYGIQVAALAGLPPAVIAKATEKLQELEGS